MFGCKVTGLWLLTRTPIGYRVIGNLTGAVIVGSMPAGCPGIITLIMAIAMEDMIITVVRYIIIGLLSIIITVVTLMFTIIIQTTDPEDIIARRIIMQRLNGKETGWIGNRQVPVHLFGRVAVRKQAIIR